MSTNNLYIATPPGRLIMGSIYEKNKTDHLNKPLPEDEHDFFIGLAIRKDEPTLGQFLGKIQQYAYSNYQQHPQIAEKIKAGLGSGFKWKIEDGDLGNNDHGKGCIIVKCKTRLPIRASDRNNQQIDPTMIKRGFYVDIALSIAPNGMTDKTAGLYINPQTVRLLGYAEEITGGVPIDQQFADAPAQLPQGASMTPVGGAMPQSQGGMGMPQSQGGMGMPQSQGGMGMPQSQGGMGMPQSQGGMGMPQQNNYSGVNPHSGILSGPPIDDHIKF